jgi:hypothetical protein
VKFSGFIWFRVVSGVGECSLMKSTMNLQVVLKVIISLAVELLQALQ